MGWIERKADEALQRARHTAATSTGVQRTLALAALDAGELIADKRSFSHVYDRKTIPIVGVDGDEPKTLEVDVLRPRASKYMGYACAAVAAGSFAPLGTSYPITGAAAVLFAGVWAAARLCGDEGLAATARRMSTISGLLTIPVAGNAFFALFLAAEVGAFRARSTRNNIRFLPAKMGAHTN